MTVERVYVGECRAEARRIVGPAMNYRERSPGHRERFEPGAFGDLADGQLRWLDLDHDATRVVAHSGDGSLVFRDSPRSLSIEATLPLLPASRVALDGLASGRYRGLSVEFTATGETRDGDTRVISSANLHGVGLVRSPSYVGAVAETRAEYRQGGLTAKVPYARVLACECVRREVPGTDCDHVRFLPGAFTESLADDTRDKLAIISSYKDAVASVKHGSLIVRETSTGLDVRIPRLPATAAVTDMIEQAGVVPVYARPVFRVRSADDLQVVDTPDGRVAIVRRALLRAILLGATDNASGHLAVTLLAVANDDDEEVVVPPRRLRRRIAGAFL